jgi:hypothetical protein
MRIVVCNFNITKRGISLFYLIFSTEDQDISAFVRDKIHIVIGICNRTSMYSYIKFQTDNGETD